MGVVLWTAEGVGLHDYSPLALMILGAEVESHLHRFDAKQKFVLQSPLMGEEVGVRICSLNLGLVGVPLVAHRPLAGDLLSYLSGARNCFSNYLLAEEVGP